MRFAIACKDLELSPHVLFCFDVDIFVTFSYF